MESELPGHHIDATNVARTIGEPGSHGWSVRIITVCVSWVVFLLTALVLMTVSLPGLAALVVAAGVASLTAAIFVLVWPATGWRAGLWASAAFLVYFLLATIAYAASGRPDWHPAFAAFIVTAAACASAAGVARLQVRSRNHGTGGISR